MYQPSAKPNDPSGSESDRIRALLENLNNLRAKLKNFAVIDELGQPIGEIKDLILDSANQLNLVIDQDDAAAHQPSVLLNGRRIKQVSVQTQSVFVDITKADVRFLPEYFLPDDAITEIAEPSMMADAAAGLGATDAGLAERSPTESLNAEAYAASLAADELTFAPETNGGDRAEFEGLDLALEAPETGLPAADDLLDLHQAEDLSLLDAEPYPAEEPLLAAGLESEPAVDDDWNLEELPNEARSLDEFGLDNSSNFELETLAVESSGALGDLEDLDLGSAWQADTSADTSLNLDGALPELDLGDTSAAGSLEFGESLEFGPEETETAPALSGFAMADAGEESEFVLSDDFASETFGAEEFGTEAFASEPFGSEEFGTGDFGAETFPSEDGSALPLDSTDFASDFSADFSDSGVDEEFNFDEPELNLDVPPEPNFAAALEADSSDAIAADLSADLAGLSDLDLAETVAVDSGLSEDLGLGEPADLSVGDGAESLDLGLDLSLDLDSPDLDLAEPTETAAELEWTDSTASASPEASFSLEEDLSDFGFSADAAGTAADVVAAEEFALGDLEFSAAEPEIPTDGSADFDFAAPAPLAELGGDTFELGELGLAAASDSMAPADAELSDFDFSAPAMGDREAEVAAEEFALGDLDFVAAEPTEAAP